MEGDFHGLKMAVHAARRSTAAAARTLACIAFAALVWALSSTFGGAEIGGRDAAPLASDLGAGAFALCWFSRS